MVSGTVRVAIVQDRPIAFAVSEGLAAMQALFGDVASASLQIAAFGEAFVGGYPLWVDHAPAAAQWGNAGTASIHQLLLEHALVDGDARLVPLQQIVDASGTLLSFGGHERIGRTLYNSQWLLRPSAAPMVHRKLVATHGERLLWGQGDGASLSVHQASWGGVGMLMCWEHWMPLTRAAMHQQGEAVHVAAWPSVIDLHLLASRHYGFEGRCFVLAAGAVQHRDDLLAGLERVGGDLAARALIQSMPDRLLQTGGSAIIAPDTRLLAQAGAGCEIISATLDLGEIGRALATFDAAGHYARPDIFTLTVDRRARLVPG